MPPDLLPTLTNFGAAGLIAWMWLAERRSAAARERHLSEAHDRLMEGRASIETLLTALTTNTRALTALELGQRAMTRALECLSRATDLRSPRRGSVHSSTDPRATDFGSAKSVLPVSPTPPPRPTDPRTPRSGSVHPPQTPDHTPQPAD